MQRGWHNDLETILGFFIGYLLIRGIPEAYSWYMEKTYGERVNQILIEYYRPIIQRQLNDSFQSRSRTER